MVSLIDSGSTYDFLDAFVLLSVQLQLDISQILELKMVDGTIIKTLGVCHGVTLSVQGYRFIVDFNVLHLGGCGWFLLLTG